MSAALSPFVVPEEASAREAIAAIGDELAVFDDWMERYQYIIELGRTLPPFPAEWADDAHRVPGCQSQVWLESRSCQDRIDFAGASDASIVSGLVALLLRVYSGRSAAEILATDPAFLKELGLLEALSANRGNGIGSMARAVQQAAKEGQGVVRSTLSRDVRSTLSRDVRSTLSRDVGSTLSRDALDPLKA